MKSKIRSLVKLVMLFCVTLLMFNCQNEESSSNQTQNKIQTVTMDEAKNFLVHSENNSLAKSTSNKLENLAFNKIAQEKINGTDQLLTIIPFATNSGFENDRILLLKIDNEIKSVIVSMYPDENSVKGSFTGKLFAYSLGGNFINGFRVEDGIIVSKFIENKNASKTNTENGTVLTLTRKSAVELSGVTVYQKKTVHALDMFGVDGIFNDFDSGSTYYSWDASGGGGASTGSSTVDLPPSCESFNFTSKKGANWQEAVVKNIYFRIIILDNKGIYVNHVVSFPQGVLFGMPINLNKGNGDISGGVAATVSAMVLNKVMNAIDKKYARTEVSDLILTTEFKSLLTSDYRTYTNGGKVNFNSISSLPAANYKTNANQTGICD